MVTISPKLLPHARKYFASVPDSPEFHTLSIPEQRKSNADFMSTVKMADDVMVTDTSIPGKAGSIPLKIYKPKDTEGPLPVVIYLHGGGWVIGSNASHAPFATNLASTWKAAVVAVDYRLAPEHPYPAAVEDTWETVLWASKHAGDFGGNPDQLIVAGESAGGNLSAVAALMAKEHGLTALKAQDTESYKELWTEKSMTAESVTFWVNQYIQDADPTDPMISPIYAKDFSGLVPAYVATTEVDVLCSEGEEYARLLKEAGVPVTQKRFLGVSHNGVFNPTLYPEESAAFMAETKQWLSQVLEN